MKNYFPEKYDSPQVWSITADSRGVMYFGGHSSIFEFDGRNWTKIPVPSQPVRETVAGPDNTIYVGLPGDLGYLARDERGKTEYVSLYEMANPEDKVVVVATAHGVYFGTDTKLVRYTREAVEVRDAQLYYLFGVKDDVYVILQGKGSYIIAGGESVPFPFFDQYDIPKDFGRVRIFPWMDGKALIATSKKGLFIHDLKRYLDAHAHQGNAPPVDPFVTPFPTEADEYIRAHQPLSGTRISDAEFALGTVSGGIVVFNDNGQLIRIINKNNGLVDDAITDLYVDDFDNMWVATISGISYVLLSSSLSFFDERNGLDARPVSLAVRNGLLYAGTFKGAYYLNPSMPGVLGEIPMFKKVEGTSEEAWPIEEKNGVLLTRYHDTLIQILDGKAHPVFEPQSSSWVNSFAFASRFPDIVFLGKNSGGIFAYRIGLPDPRSGIVDASTIRNDLLESVDGIIEKIVSDGSGDLWALTRNEGVFQVRFPNEGLEGLEVTHYGTDDGLPSDGDNEVFAASGRTFFSTPKGMYRFVKGASGTRGKFVLDTAFGDTFSEEITAANEIAADSFKNIWLGGGERFGPAYLNQTGIYVWDDRSSRACEASVDDFLADKGGAMWIATTEGIFRFDPRKKKDFARSFKALLRKVTVKDRSAKAALAKAQGSIPTLGYEENGLTFEYAATFYELPEKTEFSYKLAGFDKGWSDWTEKAETKYTNIPEGSYAFYVKAKNIYDTESQAAVYRFKILPPWYRTIWAYTAYALGLFLLLSLAVKIRTMRLTAAKEKLELLVKQRTAELEHEVEQRISAQWELRRADLEKAIADERNRLARDLHDSAVQSLYSSTLYTEAAIKLAEEGNVGQVRHALTQIADTSAQSLKEMRLLVSDLRPLELEERGLIGALRQRLGVVEERSGVRTSLKVEPDENTEIPTDIENELYRIAEEALNNALKHSRASSVAVRIIFFDGGRKLLLEVYDDGCGFKPHSVSSKPGVGLSSIKERARKIGGELSIVSSPGKGTFVSVTAEL